VLSVLVAVIIYICRIIRHEKFTITSSNWSLMYRRFPLVKLILIV